MGKKHSKAEKASERLKQTFVKQDIFEKKKKKN